MEETIGDLKKAMKRVFRDLNLDAMVSPEEGGSFTFSKGKVQHFLYGNLSGGEKAAFDLRAACKTLIDSERRKNTQASSDVGARQLARF